jgi:hypothetical protein
VSLCCSTNTQTTTPSTTAPPMSKQKTPTLTKKGPSSSAGKAANATPAQPTPVTSQTATKPAPVVQTQPKPGNYYSKLAARKYNHIDSNNSDSDSDSSSEENLPQLEPNKITKGEEWLSSDKESSDEEEMSIAIQRSLGIPVPIPAKKIAHKKVVEDKKPAAKKVTDNKKLTPKPKISVDTLYGNKMMLGNKVTIKQDKATGKVNLIQEFDKEAEGKASKPKESKTNQSRKGKGKSVASSETNKEQQSQQGEEIISADKPTHSKQTNALMKPSMTGDNKTADTDIPDTKDQVPSKGKSTEEVLSDKGKSGSNVAPKQVAQDDPDNQSDKKMTAEHFGSRFVHLHHERKAKKAREQGFTRPESLKDKLIQEGKSHPDPRDPKFPQYFKDKAIRPPSQGQKKNVSGDNIGKSLNDVTETPLTAMPYPEATPKQTGGICSTLTNIFSPGGAKSQNSSPSESSASYVDPDTAGKIEEEGTSKTTTPNVDTLEDPTAGASDAIEESGDNSTEVAPLDGKLNEAQTGTTIESNAGSEGETPRDEAITEAVADDPLEDLTTGDGDDEENGDTS